MKIHVFNPEHDIALAANKEFWTAPKAGLMLRNDLGWLPGIWADEGDVVLVNDVDDAKAELRKVLGKDKDVRFMSIKDRTDVNSNLRKEMEERIEEVCPWGWDKAIVKQLTKWGVPRDRMPDDERLEKIRNVSDRAHSMPLLRMLCEKYSKDGVVGEARCVHSVNEINQLRELWGNVVVKSPWSSSGRGVYTIIKSVDTDRITGWISKVIKEQGHIMVERMLAKVMDFGVEFRSHEDGSVTYECLSLFNTQSTAYEGNSLMGEEDKWGILGGYIDGKLLKDIIEEIRIWGEKNIADAYVGPFGVDMMIVDDKEKHKDLSYGLNPCVEVNVRRTMGHVAYDMCKCIPDTKGTMSVRFVEGRYLFEV